MAATREQVMAALFTRISASGTFQTKGRRLLDPENIGDGSYPAFFLVEANETYDRPSTSLPAVHRMDAWVVIYTSSTGDNDVPATQVNNALDAIDAAMVVDNAISNQFTLGGLVKSCVVEGEVLRANGDKLGKTVTAVPIKILFL